MRLFINRIVARSRRVPVFLSGSFMRSIAVLEAGEFSSLSSKKSLGLRLKKAFSELEKSAESPRKIRIRIRPKMPTSISEPTSPVVLWSKMNI